MCKPLITDSLAGAYSIWSAVLIHPGLRTDAQIKDKADALDKLADILSDLNVAKSNLEAWANKLARELDEAGFDHSKI